MTDNAKTEFSIKIARTLARFALLAQVAACAQTPVRADNRQMAFSDHQQGCIISSQDREALLNLDYNSFDQSLPDGGWRKYQQCPALIVELIDAYTARHLNALQKQQWDVLVWHSGQLSANAGDYANAIAKMEQTFKPNEKPTDTFLWNPYARASIAFLKKDKAELVSERKKLANGISPFNLTNLRKVDGFIRCFDSSYKEAYSGICNPPETNAERIQSLAVPFNPNKPFSKAFLGMSDFFKTKKVILVGEFHGTRTTPKVFGNIVASVASEKSKTLVALEITQSSQASIDEFLRTGDDSILKREPFFSRKYQDGRSSRAMVNLLRKLAKLPKTKVLCMDPMDGINTMTGQERDTRMATFINSNRAGYDHLLVLSGNVHSSTVVGTQWDKFYRPMGYEFKEMAKDLSSDQLLNVLVRYGRLNSWSCEGPKASDCKAHYGEDDSSDYSKAVAFPAYFVWENEMIDGHNATIFLRSTKLSPPFVNLKPSPL